MVPISMTLSDLECHFSCFINLSNSDSSMNITRIKTTLCVYINEHEFVVFNRNCFPKMKDYSRLRPF